MPTLIGTSGDDVLEGSDGDDVVFGGAGNDIIRGRGGNDWIDPGSGTDAAYGGDGDDTVVVTNRLIQGSRYFGEAGVDTLDLSHLGEGDRVSFFTASDGQLSFRFRTGDGSDAAVIQGFERFVGTQGADQIGVGGTTPVWISGGGGNDFLRGGTGADNLDGGAGADMIVVESGDSADGGEGDDEFIVFLRPGATGILEGGSGRDRLVLNDFTGGVINLSTGVIDGVAVRATGFEVLSVGGVEDRPVTVVCNDAGNTVLIGPSLFGTLPITIVGGRGADNLSGRDVQGGAGDDVLSGLSISGGEGNDTLVLSAGRTDVGIMRVVDGGSGVDTLNHSALSTARIDLAAGTLTSDSGLFQLNAQVSGIENLIGGIAADELRGDGQDNRIEGFRGNDRIEGGEGDDALFGGLATDATAVLDGDDALFGQGGNDSLFGGTGVDSLFGGAGFDLSFYAGTRRLYAANADRISGNGEGTDTLVAVEGAVFVDGVLSFDRDGQAAQVMRLYDAALNRNPDGSGFEAVLDLLEGGQTIQQVASLFLNSPEFQARFGALNNLQFIQQMYRFALRREGDAAGVQVWTDRLNSGTSRTEMLVIFSESEEHRNITQATLNAGLWVADNDALKIARMYDATFDRLADSGGLAVWTANLKGGMSMLEIATAFAGSAEFVARYGAVTNEQFIRQMYQFCLNREPDAGGLAFWVNALNTGTSRAQMLLNFSESTEHAALTRELWIGGIRTTDATASPPQDPIKGLDDPFVLPPSDDEVVIGLADPKTEIIVCLDPLNAAESALIGAGSEELSIPADPWAPVVFDFDRADLLHRIDWQTA